MDKRKSLQNNFGLEAMPILFHSSTSQFVKLIEKDGLKFLQFWWNHVGDRMPEDKRVSSAGMAYEIDVIDARTKLVTITLPSPKEDGDPYYLAMIARPERRFAWIRIPNSAVYVLLRDDKCGQENLTRLGELTPRAIFRDRGIGLKPNKHDFLRIVKTKIAKKEKKKVEKK